MWGQGHYHGEVVMWPAPENDSSLGTDAALRPPAAWREGNRIVIKLMKHFCDQNA